VRCRAHGGGQIRPGGVAAAVTARYLNSQRLRLVSSDDGLQYRPAAVRARRVLVKLNVNGADVEVNDRFARARCCGRCGTCWGLRGTKYGCGIGYCAACTVLIDGRNTKSCQTPAARAVGTAVTTVEGASATTGPRLSMTRARTRHPGSPDSHPFGRSAAPAPLQRHGDGPRPSLTTARSPTSPSVAPGTPPTNFPNIGEGASMVVIGERHNPPFVPVADPATWRRKETQTEGDWYV
jgi:hypothetical protein